MRRWVSEIVGRRPSQFLGCVGICGICLIAVGAYGGSGQPFGSGAAVKAGSIALEAVGGALLAAVVVGYLVDQITRHRLSRETGEQWLWTLLGEDTPQELKERAKDVISHGQAYLSVDFHCRIDWVEDADGRALRLQIHVITDGINHSRNEHYLPSGAAWAMPSVRAFQTRYSKWLFEASDGAGARALRRLGASNDMIVDFSHDKPPDQADFEPDGSVFLDQDDLIEAICERDRTSTKACAAAPGDRFRLERGLELFLDPTDFFPFFILVPTVDLRFKFSGEPCKDLALKARAGATRIDNSGENSGFAEFSPNGALLPGHVVIFSWHPRDRARGEDEALDDGADQIDERAAATTAG